MQQKLWPAKKTQQPKQKQQQQRKSPMTNENRDTPQHPPTSADKKDTVS
jgi:hypothetical protein